MLQVEGTRFSDDGPRGSGVPSRILRAARACGGLGSVSEQGGETLPVPDPLHARQAHEPNLASRAARGGADANAGPWLPGDLETPSCAGNPRIARGICPLSRLAAKPMRSRDTATLKVAGNGGRTTRRFVGTWCAGDGVRQGWIGSGHSATEPVLDCPPGLGGGVEGGHHRPVGA